MDPTNQETKREDNINLQEKPTDESMGIGRSYECNFCKRGFTNAQALGGHMNIHRKEKAKAKQNNQHHKYSKEDYYMSSRYFPPANISADHQNQNYQYPTSGPQWNYQYYLPPPNPSYPNDEFPQSFERIGENEACLGVNLSLQIGGSSVGDGEEKEEVERNAEVDLELRLGVYHP